MNAESNISPTVPPELALATSVGYLALEARNEGFPLVAHLLEVALFALEHHHDKAALAGLNLDEVAA